MLEELVATAHSFALGDLFLGGLVGDFTPADWQVRDSGGHGPRWIVGHLAAYRLRAMVLVGLPETEPEWAPWFKMGTSPDDVPADLDPNLLVESVHASQQALAGRWDAVGAEDLARPLGRTLPGGGDTFGASLRFLAWHEAYHLGQLGLLRRLAGKSGRA